MTTTHDLEYSFLRTEADNQYTLFLKIEASLLEQELDIELNENRQLSIKTSSGQCWLSSVLSDDIHDSLANRATTTFFTDDSGHILSTIKLPPLGR